MVTEDSTSHKFEPEVPEIAFRPPKEGFSVFFSVLERTGGTAFQPKLRLFTLPGF